MTLLGIPVVTNNNVPRGQVYLHDGKMILARWTLAGLLFADAVKAALEAVAGAPSLWQTDAAAWAGGWVL